MAEIKGDVYKLDNVKAELLKKFGDKAKAKQYRFGIENGQLGDFAKTKQAAYDDKMSDSVYCTNPYGWSVYVGEGVAFIRYTQSDYQNWNYIEIIGKNNKSVMAMRDEMEQLQIIKVSRKMK